jgi:hypothetical protein
MVLDGYTEAHADGSCMAKRSDAHGACSNFAYRASDFLDALEGA